MNNYKSLGFGVVLVALVAPLCVDWTQAQKTISQSFGSGTNQNAVYGGYGQTSPVNRQRQQQQTSSFVAPVNQQRRTEQTYVDRQVNRPAPVNYPVQQQQQEYSSSSSSSSYEQAESDAEPASYGSVNGQPGQDFPNYARVPKTSFTCEGKPYEYGMYADEETGCQAYHLCYNGRRDSFLCGPGTVFNQRILHCDYWYSVDCGKSSQYWSSNAYMGSSQPEPGPAQASGPVGSSSSSSSSYQAQSSINRPASFQRPSQSSYSRNTQEVQVQEPY